MNAVRTLLIGSCMTLTVMSGGASAAQDAAAASSAAPAGPVAPSGATAAAKRNAQREAGEPRAGVAEPAAEGTQAGPRGAATAAQPHPQAGAADRLDLGSSTVTGNQELPKVMYIVPWKKSDIGDLAGKPMNSLLDEVLAPVDRDVFRREVKYYDAVKADAAPGAKAEPAPQVEK